MMWVKILMVAIPALLAMASASVLIPHILRVAYRKRLFDPIDARKLHQKIVPRLGGVAFAPIQCCVLIASCVAIYKGGFVYLGINGEEIFPMFIMFICGMFTLFLVGLADDLIGVNFRWKFVTQIAVAAMLPMAGLWINDLYGVGFIVGLSPWIGVPLTIFAVVLIINAVNLMDGLDGLCSGIIGVGTLFLGVLFFLHGAWLHALFAFITTGVLGPFFYFNVFGTRRRKRQIFMGDTGSMTLGYSMAFLSISYAMNNSYIQPFNEGAIVVAFSTLIVPVFDVARVMFVRWRQKNPVFLPDRNHLHHKFLAAGMSHRAAMLSILGLVAFFCLFNVILMPLISNNIVILCDMILWVGFHVIFDRIQSVNKENKMAEKATFYTGRRVSEQVGA